MRQTARTPNYDGTTTGEWNAPSFSDCVAGYWKNHPDASKPEDEVTSVEEAPAAMKTWIASLSLLGSSDAETFEGLLFFPVVSPSSMALNRNALLAVVGGRGAQADISEAQLTSARKKCYSLLVKEFDWDKEDIPDEHKAVSKAEIFDKFREDMEEM